MLTEALLPVGTLLVGWTLNEISQHFRRLRTERAPVGRALADLLELRFRYLALREVMTILQDRYALDRTVAIELHRYYEHLFPPDAALPARYQAAIDEVAGTDPVLAHRLRGRDQGFALLTTLENAVTQIGESQSVGILRALLEPKVLEALDEGIAELAGAHGWRTRKKVKRQLTRIAEAKPEVQAWLAEAEKRALEAQPPPAQPGGA